MEDLLEMEIPRYRRYFMRIQITKVVVIQRLSTAIKRLKNLIINKQSIIKIELTPMDRMQKRLDRH
jgi:hypothetical protein